MYFSYENLPKSPEKDEVSMYFYISHSSTDLCSATILHYQAVESFIILDRFDKEFKIYAYFFHQN